MGRLEEYRHIAKKIFGLFLIFLNPLPKIPKILILYWGVFGPTFHGLRCVAAKAKRYEERAFLGLKAISWRWEG